MPRHTRPCHARQRKRMQTQHPLQTPPVPVPPTPISPLPPACPRLSRHCLVFHALPSRPHHHVYRRRLVLSRLPAFFLPTPNIPFFLHHAFSSVCSEPLSCLPHCPLLTTTHCLSFFCQSHSVFTPIVAHTHEIIYERY